LARKNEREARIFVKFVNKSWCLDDSGLTAPVDATRALDNKQRSMKRRAMPG
jgi:hypothetical protein